jgi:hypothetical protein
MATAGLDTWDDRPPRSYRWLWIVLALVVVIGIGIGGYYWWRAHEFDDVIASAGRLTLDPDKGEIQVVDRNAGAEVWYRVTLDKVPAGAEVPLTCAWIDPTGRIYHRNHYQTRPVTHAGWETHARCKIGADAVVGQWRVQMQLNDRTLHEAKFQIR